MEAWQRALLAGSIMRSVNSQGCIANEINP